MPGLNKIQSILIILVFIIQEAIFMILHRKENPQFSEIFSSDLTVYKIDLSSKLPSSMPIPLLLKERCIKNSHYLILWNALGKVNEILAYFPNILCNECWYSILFIICQSQTCKSNTHAEKYKGTYFHVLSLDLPYLEILESKNEHKSNYPS